MVKRFTAKFFVLLGLDSVSAMISLGHLVHSLPARFGWTAVVLGGALKSCFNTKKMLAVQQNN